MKPTFSSSRRRTATASASFIAASVAGFLAVAYFSPPQAWTTALQSIFGALLAVGAVTLTFEFSVRKTFGADLHRFLRLNEAIVLSGLSDLGPSTEVHTSNHLGTITSFSYIGRSSTPWLAKNFHHVLDAAKVRPVAITVALPDPTDPHAMAVAAEAVGLDPDQLERDVRSFMERTESDWAILQGSLQPGTEIKLMYLPMCPGFDAYLSDSEVTVLLPKPIMHDRSDDLMVIRFESGSEQFPSRWARPAFASLDGRPVMFEKKVEER